MNRYRAAEKYEQKTLTMQLGTPGTDQWGVTTTHPRTYTFRVIDVIESGERFCTVRMQRINRDGSVDARDVSKTRELTFTHDNIVNIA